jgi:N-methylhydantoinase A
LAVVEGGRFEVKSPYFVGGYDTGFPVRGAVLDIVEVGAGGGSIAWLDRQQRLHVGPQSAGSTPGPVCYGRGGTEPTVTDANLVLSRIDDSRFLGGEMQLDLPAARQAILRQVAEPLGFSGEEGIDQVAQGILALSAARMSGAIKEITLQRGLDPRDFALIVFGGGGPLHGLQLARELHIPMVIVPPHAGNFSALGMLLASVRIDSAQTFLRRFNEPAVRDMEGIFREMEQKAVETVLADTGSREHVAERYAEMRYVGQRHSLRTPLGSITSPQALRELFDATYQRRYGHADKAAELEFVSLVSSVSAPAAGVDLGTVAPIRPDANGRPRASRAVHFGGRHGRVPTPIYERPMLPAGFAAAGPAVIEEYGTTTLIGPQDRFEVGALGEIRIHCS